MFETTRLKLTAWYLAIIMAISLSFSAVIYHGLTREVERFSRGQRAFIERRMPDKIIFDNELILETKRRILIFLITINGAICILAGGLGYILAGRTLKPIKDMVEEQNRFISDASHELKTPLTSLKSAFEVHLRNKKRTLKEADTIVSESIDEVNKLQSLSESLLTLTYFQKANEKKTTLNLAEVATHAIKDVSALAAKKDIRIVPTLLPISVNGNKQSLTMLLVILLDNAIKYSKKRGTVAVHILSRDTRATIRIIDHGIGIAAQDIPHIFERFYRADTARTNEGTGGYGLGLAIAKKIADAHNARIEAESSSKTGTIFSVTLPIL